MSGADAGVGLVWVILWLPLMLVGICGCLIAFFACVGLISFLDLLWCLLMGFVLGFLAGCVSDLLWV